MIAFIARFLFTCVLSRPCSGILSHHHDHSKSFEALVTRGTDKRTTTVDSETLANHSCIQEDHTMLHTSGDITSQVVNLYIMVLLLFLMCVIEKVVFSFVTSVGLLGLFVHVQVAKKKMATHPKDTTHIHIANYQPLRLNTQALPKASTRKAVWSVMIHIVIMSFSNSHLPNRPKPHKTLNHHSLLLNPTKTLSPKVLSVHMIGPKFGCKRIGLLGAISSSFINHIIVRLSGKWPLQCTLRRTHITRENRMSPAKKQPQFCMCDSSTFRSPLTVMKRLS